MKWTKEKDNILINIFNKYTYPEISKIIGCSTSAIKNRAFKLNLKKDNNSGRFKKGDVPYNKGKKQTEYMSEESIIKIARTQFKKGHIPDNSKYFSKPYLVQRIRRNGYIAKYWLINNNGKQKGYLHYLCEINNIDMSGRVPRLKPGHNINIVPTIEDIIVVSKKEHMKLNSIQRYPEELKKTIYSLSALKRQIKKKKNG